MSSEAVGTYIALHLKVLVVDMYKLAAREGLSPRSWLRESVGVSVSLLLAKLFLCSEVVWPCGRQSLWGALPSLL